MFRATAGWLTVALLALTLPASSLDNNNDYRYRLYTQQEGLASGTLNGIKKGNRGFLWLLSNNGLSRFDGHNFKVFVPDRKDKTSIPSYVTRQLLIDGSGQIIFQTENALCAYNPVDNSFRTLLRFYEDDEILGCLAGRNGCWVMLENQLKFVSSADGNIRSHLFPDGFFLSQKGSWEIDSTGIWMARNGEIIRYTYAAGRFERLHSATLPGKAWSTDTVPVVFFSDEAARMCYMSHHGLYRWDEGQRVFLPYASLSVPCQSGSRIVKVLKLAGGGLVVGLQVDTVCFIQPANGTVVQWRLSATEKNPQPIELSDIVPASGGGVWVSTLNKGMFKVIPDKGVKEHLFHDDYNKNSLESNRVDYILDDGQVLWMALPGIGLMKAERYDPVMDAFVPSVQDPALDVKCDNVLSVFELDAQRLLVGTEGGLFQFNRQSRRFSKWILSPGAQPVLDGLPISAIARDRKGNVWLAGPSRREIYILSSDFSSMVRFVPQISFSKPNKGAVRTLYVDRKNRLWAGTNDDLMYMIPLETADLKKPDQLPVRVFEGQVNAEDTLVFNSTYGFAEDKNGNVIACTQNGLYRYMDSSGTFVSFLRQNVKDQSLLVENFRTCLPESDGNFWVGTGGGGLIHLTANGEILGTFSASNGNLSDNFAYALLRDYQGNLWVGTNRGLCQFYPGRKEFRNYTLKDGIQNNTFNTGVAMKTRNGELVFGGIGGINIIRPDAIPRPQNAPAMVLSEFRINEKVMPILPEISLKYYQNDLSFEFAAMSFYRSRENQYAYRLLGFQDEWSYQRNRRYVNFTNLPPGTYTFQAKGCSYTGIWSESWISMKIHITRPYWETTGFRFLVILCVLGIVYLFLRFRFLHRIRMEQMRTSIAQDLHDEIGSNLSGISLFAGVARKQIGKHPKEAENMLNRISEYTQVSQDAINDIVWMINTKNDRFDKIEIRMRKLAAEILESRQISFALQFDEELESVKLPMVARKNFYLIFKESLNNIVKYAECKNVTIRLTGQHGQIRLVIRDDGKGFDTGRASDGNGLINMKKRAATLGGNLTIQSAPGQGTSVELDFMTENVH